jgi:hypothetical protein
MRECSSLSRIIRRAALVSAPFLLIVFFQNCSNGFKSPSLASGESVSPGNPSPAPPAPDPDPTPTPAANPHCMEALGPYCKPSVANTGLANKGAVLTPRNNFVSQADGQMIENSEFTGCLTIRHKNVVIRNSMIRATISTDPLSSCGGVNGATARIENSEFVGTGGVGMGVSLYGNYIHGIRNDDFWRNPANAVWESNYFSDWIATSDGPHMDAIQWWWDDVSAAPANVNFTVRGNNWDLDNTYPFANAMNAILFMGGNAGIQNGITWEYNWMKSGGYVLRLSGNGVRVNYNVWEGWGWGPVDYLGSYQEMLQTNFEFAGNKIRKTPGGALESFDKPCLAGGKNMNYFGFNPYFSCP